MPGRGGETVAFSSRCLFLNKPLPHLLAKRGKDSSLRQTVAVALRHRDAVQSRETGGIRRPALMAAGAGPCSEQCTHRSSMY